MTFTRAATRELANRVRERLVGAAAYFRGEAKQSDPYLETLAASYASDGERQVAAHRLVLAAETMDEAAIFTIDAWCQRMLREHAFDSGSLFDEELVSDERALFEDAAHDYWRQHVYPMDSACLDAVLGCWRDVGVMKTAVRDLVGRSATLGMPDPEPLARLVERVQRSQQAELAHLKAGWFERAGEMERWIAAQRERNPKAFNGNKMRADSVPKWFEALRAWAQDPALVEPDMNETAWKRLAPQGLEDAFGSGFHAVVPDCFAHTDGLRAALAAIEPLGACAAAPRGRPHRAPDDGTESAQAPVRFRRHAGAPEGCAGRRERRGAARAHRGAVPGRADRRIPGYLARPVPHLQPAVPGRGQRSGARPVPDRRPQAVDLRFPRRRHPQLPGRAQRHRRTALPARHQLPLHRRAGRGGEPAVPPRRGPWRASGPCGRRLPLPARPGQSAAVRVGARRRPRRPPGRRRRTLPGAGDVHQRAGRHEGRGIPRLLRRPLRRAHRRPAQRSAGRFRRTRPRGPGRALRAPAAGRHRRAGARPQGGDRRAPGPRAAQGGQRLPVRQGFGRRERRGGRRAALAVRGRQPARRRPGARRAGHAHGRPAAGANWPGSRATKPSGKSGSSNSRPCMRPGSARACWPCCAASSTNWACRRAC